MQPRISLLHSNVIGRSTRRRVERADAPTAASVRIGEGPDRASATKAQRRWMNEQLPLDLTGLDIADLGCGMGHWEYELFTDPRFQATYPSSMTGFDNHRESLKFARHFVRPLAESSRIRFRSVDLEKRFREPKQSYDVVGACRFFNYLPTRIAAALMLRLRQIVRPGGLVLIADLCGDVDPEILAEARRRLIRNADASLAQFQQATALAGYNRFKRDARQWEKLLRLLSPEGNFMITSIRADDGLAWDYVIRVQM